ncbi:MAG: branched-chain amino acid ABC transporter permease [Spirochaetia bacterium]|nr:branched-chain amino acid ABC transporter permease [Spirochaetia bacterium]
MDIVISYLYQIIDSFSFLILSSIGLAVIFGMMNIINMAHGEFIMLGAYIFTISALAGIPFIVSVLIAVLGVTVFGILIHKLIISKLHSRPMDSIVITYGMSLVMKQLIQIIFGSTMPSVSMPLGSVTAGGNVLSVYRLVLVLISIIMLVAFYMFFNYTKFGLYSRATMQNAEVAKALGINTGFEYSMTFAIGAGIAGLAGALYAPVMAVSPILGDSFIIQAFTTVVVGGGNPLIGTFLSGTVLGVISGIVSLEQGQFIGKIAMLVAAIICIRVLPGGFSGLVEKIRKGV